MSEDIRSDFSKEADKIIAENEKRISHEEFEKDVAEKTKTLTVAEESDECMREGYEHDPKVRGPRSRPEQVRRLAGTESYSAGDALCEESVGGKK